MFNDLRRSYLIGLIALFEYIHKSFDNKKVVVGRIELYTSRVSSSVNKSFWRFGRKTRLDGFLLSFERHNASLNSRIFLFFSQLGLKARKNPIACAMSCFTGQIARDKDACRSRIPRFFGTLKVSLLAATFSSREWINRCKSRWVSTTKIRLLRVMHI